MKLKTLALSLVGFCSLLVLFQAVKIALITRSVDYSAKPFERILPNSSFKVLFLGDSTAVGIGAASPEVSTAGWLSKDFPSASIQNLSQSGLRLAGLRQKIKFIPEDEYYGLIVLQIGANDIIWLTPLKNVERDVRFILESLKNKADQIIILHSGNVGTAPIFSWPFDWILSKRSYQVREIYKRAASETNAIYVDLIALEIDRKLLSDPRTYYAPDGLHLSGEGYHLWYNAIHTSLNP